jgi:hypothetical protein
MPKRASVHSAAPADADQAPGATAIGLPLIAVVGIERGTR